MNWIVAVTILLFSEILIAGTVEKIDPEQNQITVKVKPGISEVLNQGESIQLKFKSNSVAATVVEKAKEGKENKKQR